MVVFDSVILTIVLNEDSDVPNDPVTEKPIVRARERIEYLIEQLAEQGEQIMIPSPVLGEVLVVAGSAGLRYVKELLESAVFRIEPFDTRAAIELAEITKAALAAGDKKSGVDAPWQLIKIDRQIVAIAKTAGARRIYTNDGNLATFAENAGIEVIPIQKLPMRPEDPQMTMDELLARSPPPAPEPEDDSAEIDLAELLDATEDQEEEAQGQPEGPSGTVPPSGA